MQLVLLFSLITNFIFTNDLFIQLIYKSEDLKNLYTMTETDSAKSAINSLTESFFQMTHGKNNFLKDKVSNNQLDSFFSNLQLSRDNALSLSSVISKHLPLLRELNSSLAKSMNFLTHDEKKKLQCTMDDILEIADLNPILINKAIDNVHLKLAKSQRNINSYESQIPVLIKQHELAQRTFSLFNNEMNEAGKIHQKNKKQNRFNWIYFTSFFTSASYLGWMGWISPSLFFNSVENPLKIAVLGAGVASAALLKSNINNLEYTSKHYAKAVLNQFRAKESVDSLSEKLEKMRSNLELKNTELNLLNNSKMRLMTPYSQLLQRIKLNNQELQYQANVERFKNQAAIVYFLYQLAKTELTQNAQDDCDLLVRTFMQFNKIGN